MDLFGALPATLFETAISYPYELTQHLAFRPCRARYRR